MNCTAQGARGGIRPVKAIEAFMATTDHYQTGSDAWMVTEERGA